MEQLRNERRELQRRALRVLGINPRVDRVFTAQVKGLTAEYDVHTLPVVPAARLQDSQGRRYFVPGYSAPGGADLIRGSSEDTTP